jgi:cell division protein ZipA
MDELRIILLVIGIAVIAGIYAWGHFQDRLSMPGKRRMPRSARKQPDDDAPDEALIEQELARMQQAMSDEPPDAPQQQPAGDDIESLLVISVVSGSGQPFSGDALARAFSNNQLFYGDKAIYHRHIRLGGEDVSVFGVANMFKPGDFGDGDLNGFETAGITLFLELPAPIDGLEAFDDFVQTAERLAVELGGQLQDRKHCVITHQALMQKRELLVRSRLRAPLTA